MASSTLVMVSLALILAPAVYFLLYLLQAIKSIRKRFQAVLQWPGPGPRHWFWGTTHLAPFFDPKVLATGHLDAHLNDFVQKTKRFPCCYYECYTSLIPKLMCNHPDGMREILKKGDPKPLQLGDVSYNFLRPWLGDGLLLAGGKRWARNRRLLTPAFHFDILKPYMDVYNKGTDVLLDKMDICASDGSSFEVCKHISLCTLDVLLKCAFSQKSNCQIEGENNPYVTAVRDLSLSIMDRFSHPLYSFDFMYQLTNKGRKFNKVCDYVHQVSDDVIAKRRKEIAKESKSPDRKYLDFLDILLAAQDDEGRGLTDLEIRSEVDTFLFEGHDTTASGLTWMLYCLAKYPEHQKKVQQEIDDILEGRESDDIQWEDLSKLRYLNLCIKESMRIYPPVIVISRVMEQDTTVSGRVIPAGMPVDLVIYALHHNPQVWGENHMEFIPERFLPENIQKMDPFAYLPFAAGPRNCIGQNFAMNEMKVMLARVLRRFDLTVDPNHKVHFAQELLLKPANDIKLKLKRRL